MSFRAIPLSLALFLALLLAGCGKRLPPPPPYPDYTAQPAGDPGGDVAGEGRPSAEPRGRRASRPSGGGPVAVLPAGPVDPILASPWAAHDGIEERVGWWVEFWQTRGMDWFDRYLTRMGRYEEFIEAELAARGMPPSLKYLPLIEAGYFPTALSSAGAGGLWQFMPPTARWLGLTVTSVVDERFDPYRATPVALDYLLSLNQQFGSWFLTLAAYNSGPGRIERIVRRHGGGDPRDDALFWKIRDELPAETRDFVPKYLAAVRLGNSAAAYGFTRHVQEPPQTFDVVTIRGSASLDVVAEVAGATEEEVRDLNPHLIRGLTPRGASTPVRLPPGSAGGFEARFAAIPPEDRVTFTEHRVAVGETLSHIAADYRVSVADLQDANPTIRPRRLQIGTLLVIPQDGARPSPERSAAKVDAPAGVGSTEADVVDRDLPRTSGRIHIVSRGESLWLIARLYRVEVRQLREWNDLGQVDTLFPGDELRIREPGSVMYTVRAGDTIWDIARAHRLSTDQLIEYNGLSDRGLIRPGDQIQIPPSGPSEG